MKFTRFTKFLLIIFPLVGFFTFVQGPVFGQVCNSNVTAPVLYGGWQRGTVVKVFIDLNNMTPAAQQAVKDSVAKWNAANQANGSGVYLRLSPTRPQFAERYIIVRTDTNVTGANGVPARAVNATTRDPNTGVTKNSLIRIEDVMTNYDAVLEAMVHEIGHTFGLDHCPNCGLTDSIMATAPYNPNDKSTYNTAYGRATAPTTCDNYKLHAVNYPDCGMETQDYCTRNMGSWNSTDCTCNFHNYDGGGLTYCEMYPGMCNTDGGGYSGPRCYDVYERTGTQICIEGSCGPMDYRYEYAYTYCTW